MNPGDIDKVEVFVGHESSLVDVLKLVAWPVLGAIDVHDAVKEGNSRLSASRRYAALLTIWLVGASLCVASLLAV